MSTLVLAVIFSTSTFASTELAKVNGSVISLEDFNKRFQENRQLMLFRAPNKKAFLDEVINRELAVQEAKKLKLDKDPDIVERINTVLYYALLERQLGKQVESIFVTDDEAKKFYDKNPEIRTSHLFVAVPPGSSAVDEKAAMQRLKKIYDENVAGGKMTFAEAAQRFSEGPSAPMGGDLDYQMKDRLDPAYYATALSLKPGKVSGIVRSAFGYHIIRLTATRAWEDTDQAQVKRLVFEDKRNQLFSQFLGRLRASGSVQIKAELIKE
jgi:peptidyl-prolyl cis-trans isomerase C/peptidyl-prolyl cis-trans isomerase D